MIGSSPRVALVVIFNHRFDQNLPRLQALYGERFSRILYLVPFYQGDFPGVVPVFGNSFYFHSYLAQAAQELRAMGSGHYVVIGDDVLLHPDLHEGNLPAALGLVDGEKRPPRGGYCKELRLARDFLLNWPPARKAFREFLGARGVNYVPELPDTTEAWRRMERHRLDWGGGFRWKLPSIAPGALAVHLLALADCYRLAARQRKAFGFPLVGGYADFFAVSAGCLDEFLRLCAVFASIPVFVEVALPTALALACPALAMEADIVRRGVELWERDRPGEFNERYGFSLARLRDEFFTPETLYVHPIKLSRWH